MLVLRIPGADMLQLSDTLRISGKAIDAQVCLESYRKYSPFQGLSKSGVR